MSLPTTLQAGAPKLNDGPGGMTCQYFDAEALAEWQAPGGDWVDAAARPRGSKAFDQVDVLVKPSPQWVDWDLSRLVRMWDDGSALAGVVALRALPSRAGAVTFASREYKDRGLAPTLVLKWSDGQSQRLSPLLDTFFACPTYGSLGQQPGLDVSGDRMTVLAFAYQPRPGAKPVSARLMLASTQQFGQGASVGAFGMRLPETPEPESGPGLARAYPLDRGLASQPGVLYTQDFETTAAASFAAQDPSTRGSLRVVDGTDATDAVYRPLAGKALAVTVRRGTQTALNHHLRLAEMAGGEPDEAYFRYYLRLGDHWDPSVDGGKMPGFAGTYGRAGWGARPVDGRNGWSARGGFMRHPTATDQSDDGTRALASYVYLPTSQGVYGEIWGWNLGPTGRLAKNRWTSIEQYVKLNQPGRADGEFRAWVDGKLVVVRKGLRWRDVPTLHVESVWLNIFHGGVANADRDLTLYLDNLVIARQYIGPGDFPGH